VTIADNSTNELDHYSKLEELERRFTQLDRHLADGVETLLRIAEYTRNKDPNGQIPAWFSATVGEPEPYPLCHAIVCATLQKVWRQRRRYSYSFLKGKEELIEWLPQPFIKPIVDSTNLRFVEQLNSRAFGALNPLTSSQVLRVLLQTGETATIAPLGTLSVFSILWALHRRHGENKAAGAALDPWRPTAAITAKCVFVLDALRENCVRRASLLREIAGAFATVHSHRNVNGVRDRWLLCHAADRVATHLYEFAEMSAVRSDLVDAAEQIAGAVASRTSTSPATEYDAAATTIEQQLTSSFTNWRLTIQRSVAASTPVLDTLILTIISTVQTGGRDAEKYFWQLTAETRSSELIEAAQKAHSDCRQVRALLESGVDITPGEPLGDALHRAAKSYEDVAQVLDDALQPAIRWCQIVVRDQIAHASALNYTDFDPAELVSAIAVSRMSEAFSMLESRDAIEKSLSGLRADGSWSRGQPIYLRDRVLGVWPSTPDIVWALCTALDKSHGVDKGDVLKSFVDWVERNRTKVRHRNELRLHGWSTELYRDEQTVDVWTTAVTVNALIEIRQILEQTAREMCAQRFTIVPVTNSLDKIDPVDLGAIHGRRLHRTLAQAVRQTRHGDDDAPYSVVFHGPPGSSKTALANALAKEMWDAPRGDGTLIRITPADFTRLGSDRLDSEARFIFGLLARTRRVTILFDEIDDLLRVRTAAKPTFFDLVVPAMLNRLQDLRDAAPRQEISFVVSTNYIDRVEPALIRSGRIDHPIPVPYPDAYSRVAIFEKEGVDVTDPEVNKLIERLAGLPWAEVRRAAKQTVTIKDAKSVFTEKRRPNDVNQYYVTPERWRPLSEPLLNEMLHVVASRAMYRSANVKTLTEIAEKIGLRTGELQEQFALLCDTEGR
jgi:hypothetical protein